VRRRGAGRAHPRRQDQACRSVAVPPGPAPGPGLNSGGRRPPPPAAGGCVRAIRRDALFGAFPSEHAAPAIFGRTPPLFADIVLEGGAARRPLETARLIVESHGGGRRGRASRRESPLPPWRASVSSGHQCQAPAGGRRSPRVLDPPRPLGRHEGAGEFLRPHIMMRGHNEVRKRRRRRRRPIPRDERCLPPASGHHSLSKPGGNYPDGGGSVRLRPRSGRRSRRAARRRSSSRLRTARAGSYVP
jgi:hypothetical protein